KSQADSAADLNRQRFAAGAISRADLNLALRDKQQASADLVRTKAALTLAWIALQKSLGLGWQEPAEGAVAAP
ncbi:MAG: TolC family protein, partial [Alphaproteobacteria bacterium]|nr:TolC family protein [Alphaproteobacteria bacterium]